MTVFGFQHLHIVIREEHQVLQHQIKRIRTIRVIIECDYTYYHLRPALIALSIVPQEIDHEVTVTPADPHIRGLSHDQSEFFLRETVLVGEGRDISAEVKGDVDRVDLVEEGEVLV